MTAELASEAANLNTHKPESPSFLRTALTLQGTVATHIGGRMIALMIYAALISLVKHHYPDLELPITPFEYSGAVLGIILVVRLNAGHDRWWEARRLWGSILNQSRNLAVIVKVNAKTNREAMVTVLKWIAAWPHVIRQSLRQQISLNEVEVLLGKAETHNVRVAQHMPTYVGLRIAEMIDELRHHGLSEFAFLRAETERATIIDAIGGSERIKNTGIPIALAVLIRRFLLLFLLLLPLAFADRLGWITPFIVGLTAYPILALDQIGAELQRPFDPNSVSHLPLDSICKTIENNILAMIAEPSNASTLDS